MLHDLTLEGHGTRLVPLADEHAEPLSAFVDDRLWAGMSSPTPDTPAAMRAEIRAAHAGAQPVGVHGPGQRDGRGPRLDVVLRLGPADRARRDRVHLLRPALVGHHEQPRLQAADAHARVRDVGLRPRGVPGRRPQRAARSRPSDASARCRRVSCAATAWHPTAPAATARTSRSSPTSGPRSAPAWRPGSAQRGDRARSGAACRSGRPSRRTRSRPSTRAIRTVTVPGRSTGFTNSTDHSNASPRPAPTSASARDAVYMPCAMARGNPSALADSADRWIGLRSPETAAYRRPTSPSSFQRPVGVGGTNGVASTPSSGPRRGTAPARGRWTPRATRPTRRPTPRSPGPPACRTGARAGRWRSRGRRGRRRAGRGRSCVTRLARWTRPDERQREVVRGP